MHGENLISFDRSAPAESLRYPIDVVDPPKDYFRGPHVLLLPKPSKARVQPREFEATLKLDGFSVGPSRASIGVFAFLLNELRLGVRERRQIDFSGTGRRRLPINGPNFVVTKLNIGWIILTVNYRLWRCQQFG